MISSGHKIWRSTLFFIVYNFEYYKSYPLKKNLVLEIRKDSGKGGEILFEALLLSPK
jgi:hypothetical protein